MCCKNNSRKKSLEIYGNSRYKKILDITPTVYPGFCQKTARTHFNKFVKNPKNRPNPNLVAT